MGQTLRKIGGGRVSSAVAPKKAQQPTESRFQDPSLRGHVPGDVLPEAPYPPTVALQNKEREWDRADPMYAAMVKDLAGSVVMTPGPKGASEDAYLRRPLPKIRHSVNRGFDEDRSVPPGTLNVGYIRQVFLSYQGLIDGEKPMNARDLAKKYNVDAVLLEKVLHFHALPDRNGELKSAQVDNEAAARLE